MSSVLLVITVISLGFLGFIFITEKIKTSFFTKNKQKSLSVLGEESHSPPLSSQSNSSIDRYFNTTLEDTKEIFSQKAASIQKKVVDTLEKETSDFAKSQIREIELKICTQWGIITPSLSRR